MVKKAGILAEQVLLSINFALIGARGDTYDAAQEGAHDCVSNSSRNVLKLTLSQ